MDTERKPCLGTTGDTASHASGGAAVITYAANADWSHVIDGVAWSYGGAPTAGNLQIADGSNVVFTMDITTTGNGSIIFPSGLMGTKNTAMTITLADGSQANKVNALGHRLWQR
jgi:hypothetical protein